MQRIIRDEHLKLAKKVDDGTELCISYWAQPDKMPDQVREMMAWHPEWKETRDIDSLLREAMKLSHGAADPKAVRAEIERQLDHVTFVMELEPHTPPKDAPEYPCGACVLSHGPMCLDRTYCRFKQTGKTWKKRLED
jgi:hypothetical protein